MEVADLKRVQRRSTGNVLPGAALIAALLVILLALPPSGALGTTEPSATPAGGEDEEAQSEVTAELPPPDIPTANEQGYTFKLKAGLKVDLDALPKEAAVYELIWPEPTFDDAQQVADRLRIGGSIEDRGNGIFEASGAGQVFVSADLVQYFSLEDVREGDLPADDEAIAYAREWLRLTGLLPPDLGEARIVGRVEESQRVVARCRLTVQFLEDESERAGTSRTFAEPVRRKRPGVRSRSTAPLIAEKRRGTCCTSSRTTRRGRSSTKPIGSASAALRTASASKLR